MPSVSLEVNGKAFGGWKHASVTRGIEAICGHFELTVSERWAGQPIPWQIVEEDECKVFLDGKPVLAGYVDRRSIRYSATDHELTVSGRDKAADLVDCSAFLEKEWEFVNTSVLTLARRIAKPFEIPVTLQAGVETTPVQKLAISPGDGAFDVIERACRLAGVLATSNGAGGILLTRAGTSRATSSLIEGENIISASADFDGSGRFRKYVILGQHPGTDDYFGDNASKVRGTATDATVRRAKRILVLKSEDSATPAQAQKRALWEASVRAARGDAVSVTVQGWTQADGSLWPVNALVPLKSPLLGLAGDMLITQATYQLDDAAGTTTDLTLKRPDAFKPEPVKPFDKHWNETENKGHGVARK